MKIMTLKKHSIKHLTTSGEVGSSVSPSTNAEIQVAWVPSSMHKLAVPAAEKMATESGK